MFIRLKKKYAILYNKLDEKPEHKIVNICIQAEQSFYSKLNQKLNQKNNVQNLSQIFVEEIFYLLDKKTIYITNLVISWLILHFQIGYFSLLTLLKIISF